MTIPLDSIPNFSAAEALAAAAREYGLAGPVSSLPSERDQNFVITDARSGRFVLKIGNSNDAEALLDFQNQGMRRVRDAVVGCRVPGVVNTLAGAAITRLCNPRSGSVHCMRLLAWVDGNVLANTGPRGPALFASIGAAMARIDAALAGFEHPAMRRVLQWDLRRADMARENAVLLAPARRTHVERLFRQWEAIDWSVLRHGVIHGDANDHNVIVDGDRMVGLLDFGDMVYSARVCDLAIALAYVIMGEADPMTAAAQVVRAFHRVCPLTGAEQGALLTLVRSRLAMSVCFSAHNRARNPGDPYQVVSEAAAWELLDRLDLWREQDALELIQAACAVDSQ